MALLRTTARAAVAANVATRVHHRTAARQQAPWQQMTAAPPHPAPPHPAPTSIPMAHPAPAPSAGAPPAAPAAASSDTATLLAQLGELGRLRDAGVLTNAEFELQKARLLGT